MGYFVRCPLGGMAWHHLQYAIGLAQLGHEILFIEDSGDEPWACYDPQRGITDADPSYGLRFAHATFQQVGLGRRWAYHDALGSRWHGPAASGVGAFCRSADVLLNLSGENPLRSWVLDIPVRVYVDTDPVFTQLRHLTSTARLERARQHTAFLTFGENWSRSGHSIPDDGFAWRPTRQPVVLDAWPATAIRDSGRFTTVMQWDNTLQDAPREFAGTRFGRKADSFPPYMDLPALSGLPLEIALGGEAAPRSELRARGWSVRDPLQVTRDPWTYQRYIQHSRGEFSVAKSAYVVSRSGWFSERTAVYLASGRPAVVQDTGFTDWLDAGEGIIAFDSPPSAAAALRDVQRRYEVHRKAARSVAERMFDSRLVLRRLLEQCA